MCKSARSFTHKSNTCVIRRLCSWILASLTYCLVLAPCHPPQPRIKEFWFVHKPQNLEIALREVGDFQRIVLPFGVWVIGVAPRRVWKIKQSIEVRTSEVRLLKFGLSELRAPDLSRWTFFLSFLGGEDPTLSPDKADIVHLINHVGPKKLPQTVASLV